MSGGAGPELADGGRSLQAPGDEAGRQCSWACPSPGFRADGNSIQGASNPAEGQACGSPDQGHAEHLQSGTVSRWPPARRGLRQWSHSEEDNQLYTVDISADGATFATAGRNRAIRVYDLRNNQLIDVLEAADYVSRGKELRPVDGHTRRIYALRFHPQERHIFVSGGWDDSIKVWDKRLASQARKVINGPHICGPGIDIRNNKILTGSWVARDALQIWDFRKSSAEKNIPFPSDRDHGEFIYAARYCTGDTVIAGGSGTNSAQVVNIRTDTVLGEIKLQQPVHTVASVLDGQQIAVAGGRGNLHVAYLL